MRATSIPVLLAVLGITSAGAQQVLRKEPFQYTGPDRASRVEARPPGMRLGLRSPREFALAPLSESESAHLAEPSTRLKTGIQRKVAPHSLAAGVWEKTSESTRIWRMALRSPRARGIRVEFANFDVGEGRVWLHDGTHVAGPYSGQGLYGDGHFFSGSVFAESAILEYEPAPGTREELEPPFEIRSVVHEVRTAIDVTAGTPDTADYCELDPNCFPDWKPAMSSVGQIVFMDGGDEVLCSGSLLATRDNSLKPYFLTAGHCINTEDAARTVQAYWTYQTSACGGPAPTSRNASTKSSLGAHLISFASLTTGDYSLILLPDVPSGVTFAGWDTTDPPASTDLTAIHHPSGSWKRISFGQRVGDAANVVEGVIVPAVDFLQVQWISGRVEPGSSGSPLFSAPGVVVGSLSYGEVLDDGTVCTINPSVAGYGRFSNTYSQVSTYLENLPSDTVLPAKPSMAFALSNQASPAGQVMQLTTQSTGQVAYKLRADANWIVLSAITGTLTAKTAANVTVSVDPAKLPEPGQYNSTVTIFSGASAPAYLNVSATVKMDQSNVVATISPNPVVQSGGQWSFQIRLLETAGVSTHLTALKFNGQDYTSSIGTWFGTVSIAANGALVAPLSGAGLFPAGPQYFEFWGIDDASGATWYRTAVVTFQ
jgi:hypothetical protein